MPATTMLPSLSQVQTMDTAHLREADRYWTRTANLWEQAFSEVHERLSTPGGTLWEGQAAAAAHERSYTDLVKIRGAVYQLHEAAEIARRADEQLQASREMVLDAVREARADGFDVGEDYSVTDRSRGGSAEFRAARRAAAQGHLDFIRHRVAALVANDQGIAAEIAAATEAIDTLTFEEAPAAEGPANGKHNGIQLTGYGTWKQEPPPPPPPQPPPPARGLPPEGVRPPVPGNLTPGPASRPSERVLGGQSLWDEKGGEWRYFPGDKYHNPHWDYNPHDTKFPKWQNIPIGDQPALRPPPEPAPAAHPPTAEQPVPPVRGEPTPPPAAPPVKSAPVEPPAPPAPPRTGIGGGSMGGGSGSIPQPGHSWEPIE